MPDDIGGGWRGELAFLRRTLIVAAVAALALFLWTVRDALLLVFAAVVVAVLLRAVAEPLEARLGLSHRISVVAACMIVVLPLLIAASLVGSEVRTQAALLAERLPEVIDALERRFGVRLPTISAEERPPGDAPSAASTVGAVAWQAASAIVLLLDALAALLLAAVGGIFIAAHPKTYGAGLIRLLPRSQHHRVQDALLASGRALRLWLLAQLASMVLVGLLVGLGTWMIGLPAPLALGLFAALADFVPLIGPVVGAVPGVLVAIGLGWDVALWTVLLYVVVQQIEANILFPLLGERIVAIPPALLLFSVVAAGALLGFGGILLAAPLTVVAFVLVGKLYVQETLGEPAEVPGEKPD